MSPPVDHLPRPVDGPPVIANRGAVANISKAASIRPRMALALADLLSALRGPDCALGKLRQEMIAVLTSALHRCTY